MTVDVEALKSKLEGGMEGLAGILAARKEAGSIVPFLFTSQTGLDDLAVWPWYRVADTVSALLKKRPDAKIGVVVRGCDERALVELHKRNQVDMDRLVLFGVACDPQEQSYCYCDRPYPTEIVAGEKNEPAPWDDLATFLEKPLDERLAFFRKAFDRCIKCYGCRNTCPMCFCHDCTLEEDVWVETGVVPPPMTSFHLIRAMHMTERCIACRECEAACPSNIPLTTLYRLLRRDMGEMFGYETGADKDQLPPLNTKGAPEDHA